MKTTFIFISIFGFASFFQSASAQTTAKPKRILIENPTVHVGDGSVFEKGLVGIEGDKIILVKNGLA